METQSKTLVASGHVDIASKQSGAYEEHQKSALLLQQGAGEAGDWRQQMAVHVKWAGAGDHEAAFGPGQFQSRAR